MKEVATLTQLPCKTTSVYVNFVGCSWDQLTPPFQVSMMRMQWPSAHLHVLALGGIYSCSVHPLVTLATSQPVSTGHLPTAVEMSWGGWGTVQECWWQVASWTSLRCVWGTQGRTAVWLPTPSLLPSSIPPTSLWKVGVACLYMVTSLCNGSHMPVVCWSHDSSFLVTWQ